MTNERIRRWSDRSILVLTSVANGPKHGNPLFKNIDSFAGVTMGPGTRYVALAKLGEFGLIEALAEDDRRRPHFVTAASLELLRGRLSASARLAAFGLARFARAAS